MNFYSKNKKKINSISVLVVVILFLFFGLHDEVIYAKSGPLGWLPFILIFGVIPYFFYRIADAFGRIEIGTIGLGSIMVLGPLFGFWNTYKSNKDLQLNGIYTKGVICEQWSGRRDTELIRCKFQVGGEEYLTYSKKYSDRTFNIGDSLTVWYSGRYPPNNKIILDD